MKTNSLKVWLTFTEPMLGTVGKNKEPYKTHVIEKKLALAGHSRNDIQKAAEEETSTMPELEERGWTGFMSDEEGLFVYDYMIRGFLKAAATALKDQKGLKNVRSKIDTYVFIFPRRVHFLRDGKFLKSPDGVIERPLRAQTMQGPRVTLARSDYVNAGTALDFEVCVIDNAKEFTAALVGELFEYGQLQGLGQFRGGSYGRFTAKIE